MKTISNLFIDSIREAPGFARSGNYFPLTELFFWVIYSYFPSTELFFWVVYTILYTINLLKCCKQETLNFSMCTNSSTDINKNQFFFTPLKKYPLCVQCHMLPVTNSHIQSPSPCQPPQLCMVGRLTKPDKNLHNQKRVFSIAILAIHSLTRSV